VKSKLIGKTFGGYEVLGLSRVDRTPSGGYKQYFECRCTSCGGTREVDVTGIKSNKHGCRECANAYRRENEGSSTKSKHPLYSVWSGMIYRCENKNSSAYKYYGARGIQVCVEWRESFEAFVRDVGERPPGTSLGRIDNDGWYSPQNCRWETPEQQANNTSGNVLVTVYGETKTVTQWAKQLEVPDSKLRAPHVMWNLPYTAIIMRLMEMPPEQRNRYVSWVIKETRKYRKIAEKANLEDGRFALLDECLCGDDWLATLTS
jgi:hypothetical protein